MQAWLALPYRKTIGLVLLLQYMLGELCAHENKWICGSARAMRTMTHESSPASNESDHSLVPGVKSALLR